MPARVKQKYCQLGGEVTTRDKEERESSHEEKGEEDGETGDGEEEGDQVDAVGVVCDRTWTEKRGELVRASGQQGTEAEDSHPTCSVASPEQE